MSIEKFGAKIYRDGLAESLKDLRKNEVDGSEKAKQFLALAQETKLYQEALDIQHPLRQGKDFQEAQVPFVEPVVEEVKVIEQQAIESPEAKEQRIITELLHLIEHDPGVVFGVSANGSLYGQGADRGQFGYLLDQHTKTMTRKGSDLLDPIVYDGNLIEPKSVVTTTKVSTLEPNRIDILKPEVINRKIAQQDQTFGVFRCYINGNAPRFLPRNPFTFETRNAVSLNGALFVRAGAEMDGDVLSILKCDDKKLTAQVLWKFFVAAFEKHTPGYWKFMREQWEQQPNNKGRDIQNPFE